jgi:hypothetical protein
MNAQQRLWCSQARSDYDTFKLLNRHGSAPCHQLHYLQMATEKLAKAHFWRSNRPPTASHRAFTVFVRTLLRGHDEKARTRVAQALGYGSEFEYQAATKTLLPVAYEIERLAPALAFDGPNAEYPWPAQDPASAPVDFEFPVWSQLIGSASGRQFLQFLERAVTRFDTYA